MNNTITVLQHNVLHWQTNKHTLIPHYKEINPDILLINSHGLKSNEQLKIPGYICHKINSTESIHDGSAIAVKYGLFYKLKDDYITDFLSVELNTS